MTAEARLIRLYPALTAKERARLVLQHYKDRTNEEPAIRLTMPSSQVNEFNRLIRLLRAIDQELGYAAIIIAEQVKQLDLKYGWMMSLLLWGMETDTLGDLVLAGTKDRRLREDVRKLMKRAPGALRVPIDLLASIDAPDIFAEGYGQGMVRALLAGIKDGLEQHWRELRSLEIVIGEAAEEFDGRDLLREDDRKRLDDAKATCVTVHEAVQPYVEPFALPEPADDDVELVRTLVQRARES